MAFSTPRMSNRASPFPRTSPTRARSPTRSEQALVLKQVIGSTATSSNGFAIAASRSVFAFVAGAGGLLVALEDDGQLSQRFYYARPSVPPLVTTPSVYDSPTPIGQQGPRHRTTASLRESGYGSAIAGYPWSDVTDSPTAKSGAASKTKAASCVALSPDGKLMAVGETGHKPRVLLFSTARDSPRDIPQNALSEHTFGVRCLAFSPDSQYLASLGDTNDGFLYIWIINRKLGTAYLKASNKCTSNIKQIVWMGNNLVTIGTRHVKIWRLDQPHTSPSKRLSDAASAFGSPSSRTLFGRNCLLGPMLDKTFTAIVPISHVQAIVCSDTGDVCLLDDGPVPAFTKIADCGFAITAITVAARDCVLMTGLDKQIRKFDIRSSSGLLLPDDPVTLLRASFDNDTSLVLPVTALGLVREDLVIVDKDRGLHIYHRLETTNGVSFNHKQSFPAHPTAVLGLRVPIGSAHNSAFMTWSADGTVICWDANGICTHTTKVALEQVREPGDDFLNELRAINTVSKGSCLISGDRLGVLRITDLYTGKSIHETKAHSNEITDIALFEADDDVLIATASRDRTMQLFRWHSDQRCEHLQTIEEHNGAINSVQFSADGNILVSASSDRTLMLLDAVPNRSDGQGKVLGYLARRPINLRASPQCVCTTSAEKGIVLVSTGDRQISRYNMASGILLSSFKTSDQEGGDAVMLNSIAEVSAGQSSSFIVGVATSDKSIRLYDQTGRLLDKQHGHTEGMMGVAVLRSSGATDSQLDVVTVASDGTILRWNMVQSGQQLQEAFMAMSLQYDNDTPRSFVGSRPPLRRVLSSSELTRLVEVREDNEGSISATNSARRPQLRPRTSRLSLKQTPKLNPPSLTGSNRKPSQQSPIGSERAQIGRRSVSTLRRSPSPVAASRKAQIMRVTSRGTPVPPQARRKSMSAAPSPSAPNALTVSTDALCRSLHAYRKKLSSSSDILALESVRELERELSQTAKVLAEKSARNDTVMAKILDQYSEKLVGLLDEKIEASIARQIRRRADTDDTNGNGNDDDEE